MTLPECYLALQDARNWAWILITGFSIASFVIGCIRASNFYRLRYGPEIDRANDDRARMSGIKRRKTV